MDDTEENFGSMTGASSNEIKMGEDLDDFSHIYGIDGPGGMNFREYSPWAFRMVALADYTYNSLDWGGNETEAVTEAPGGNASG